MRNRGVNVCICMLLSSLVLVGCATVDSRWKEAAAKNTISAYEEFLRQHPDSPYTAGAKEQIESLQWQEATANQNIYALQHYLFTYPDGKHSSEARKQLEVLEWENAKSRNTAPDYEAFVKKYPGSAFATQAQSELKKFARVVVDFPDRLKSQKSYYNIGGPVWVFRIVFRETNGVAATMNKKKMRISSRGKEWGDWGYEEIFNSEPSNQGVVRVEIPAGGTGSYSSWVNSPDCNLCGGTLLLEYSGIDANGHTIGASKRFILER